MNQTTAIQYLRSTLDEMTMHEFHKKPIKDRMEFCKAALKATENISKDDKEIPALLKPTTLGCGDPPCC